MKRFLKIFLPVLILGAAVGVFATLKATKPVQPKAAVKERVWRVDVEAVQPARLAPSLMLYGQAEAPELFRAAAPGPARVAEVTVREGDWVTRDQELVVLDPRDFTPRLRQAEADVAELRAQIRSEEIRHDSDLSSLEQEKKLLRLTQDGVERQRRLMKQQLGSESTLDEAEQALARQQLTLSSRSLAIADHPARLQALQARLSRAESRLEEVRLEVERSRVQAPFDGIVARVPVAVGDQVMNNAELLAMYNPAELEVRARIPAPYQAELERAMAQGRELEAEARYPGGSADLRLVRLAGQADSNGVDALFRLHGSEPRLRAGQVLTFRLRRPAVDDAVAVPYPALYGNDRVYVLDDGRLRSVSVSMLGSFIDAAGEERALVQGTGLAAGDRLVLTHLPNAIDGLRAEAAR